MTTTTKQEMEGMLVRVNRNLEKLGKSGYILNSAYGGFAIRKAQSGSSIGGYCSKTETYNKLYAMVIVLEDIIFD